MPTIDNTAGRHGYLNVNLPTTAQAAFPTNSPCTEASMVGIKKSYTPATTMNSPLCCGRIAQLNNYNTEAYLQCPYRKQPQAKDPSC